MKNFSINPAEIYLSIWRHRGLIQVSAKREILSRYRGSALGIIWSLFNPIFMLAVYTFVFSIIFKARWGGGDGESKVEFALVLFAGLIVFNLFAECINRSPSIITSNVNYVKKVVFPLEVLPYINLLSALYHAAISLIVWMSVYVIFVGAPKYTMIYLPMIVIPFALFIMGISWILASLGVYLRDISQLIGVVTMSMMFLSPVFYPVTAIPEKYQMLLYMNPLTPAVELTRDVLYWGLAPNMSIVLMYWIIGLLVAWIGFAWFQKTRKGFSDVL